jgi:hypothetical protein
MEAIIKFDENNQTFLKLIEYLKTIKGLSIEINEDTKLTGIEEALKDVEEGRVFRVKNVKELREECLK